MRLVVLIGRAGFAVGTEVQVVANGTLVANTTDVSRRGCRGTAEWPITADPDMNRLSHRGSVKVGERLIDSGKSVPRVHEVRILDTVSAVVPVRAVEALVADASDVGVTSITDGVVGLIATGRHLHANMGGHLGARDSSCETMLGVVAVGILGEAWLAEIIIFTGSAVEKFSFRQFSHALVACSHVAENRPPRVSG